MRLWLVMRTDGADWDEYEGFVCAAMTKQDAAAMHPSGEGEIGTIGTWVGPEKIKVTLLGQAKQRTPGVILASFNAG